MSSEDQCKVLEVVGTATINPLFEDDDEDTVESAAFIPFWSPTDASAGMYATLDYVPDVPPAPLGTRMQPAVIPPHQTPRGFFPSHEALPGSYPSHGAPSMNSPHEAPPGAFSASEAPVHEAATPVLTASTLATDGLPDSLIDNASHEGDSNVSNEDEVFLPGECTYQSFDQQLSRGLGRSLIHQTLEEAKNSGLQVRVPVDATFPDSLRKIQGYVALIAQALKSCERAIEIPRTVKAFQNAQHSGVAHELAAWRIMDLMIQRHTRISSLTTTHTRKVKPVRTFWEHFQEIYQALAQSKSLSKRALNDDWLRRFVDAPNVEFDAVKANQKLNNRKRDIIACGTAALATKVGMDAKSGEADESQVRQSKKETYPTSGTSGTSKRKRKNCKT